MLIALYENGTPFEPHFVDLGDPASREAFLALWPVGRMPVLVDRSASRTVPESSIIIEYLDHHYPGATPLIPTEFDEALETRLQDRFFDLQMALPTAADGRVERGSEGLGMGDADELQAIFESILPEEPVLMDLSGMDERDSVPGPLFARFYLRPGRTAWLVNEGTSRKLIEAGLPPASLFRQLDEALEALRDT